MRQFLLGICAVALISLAVVIAAQAQEIAAPTPTATAPGARTAQDSRTAATAAASPAAAESTAEATAAASQPDRGTTMRLAAMDTSLAAFRKLDKDHDGRISALEAADNPKVAAAFTMADKDKDGYLSLEEFEAMSSASTSAPDVAASSPSGDQVSNPSGDRVSDPSGDQTATGPNETSTSSSPRPMAHPRMN